MRYYYCRVRAKRNAARLLLVGPELGCSKLSGIGSVVEGLESSVGQISSSRLFFFSVHLFGSLQIFVTFEDIQRTLENLAHKMEVRNAPQEDYSADCMIWQT